MRCSTKTWAKGCFPISYLSREEISTLSRQASFRRVNSVSTDARDVLLEVSL